ncbi:8-oxo-dGTP pyrophosphatase MutT (NUDIX family) [Mycolicibacterium sp. BK556]|uniref:NUDIX hydrolase n=1 Tax=unclassified Mycolicibacterium TaxID=2636767 RepID=UPI001617C4EA|nr:MULTISPECIES: CoA pyrophosphatase [unclassified Mycolicibacterium]MBB3606627.1 8-oxo-dGTP pyrophosphatase MutT (NUDIX family) [Mycolicibacterium sp. BK556]MBB3636126.1 8-oxo-dGTP pyrophosphatase MutT (NUDIX family) [Mycolicibacterium sp. BK607]
MADHSALSAGVEDFSWRSRLSALVTGRYAQTEFPQESTVTARTAAVLVLLTNGDHGIEVLLTQRASGMRNHAGLLSFPGGSRDVGDTDPTSTALREAQEEVGLERASVQLLGLLPPVTDPKAKFVVVPVLAWSAGPVFSGVVSYGEVSAIRHIPIRDLAPGVDAVGSAGASDEDTPSPTVGYMTTAIIDLVWALIRDSLPEPWSGS